MGTEYRKELLKMIQLSSARLSSAVASFNMKVANDPINVAELQSFPLMEWVPLEKDILIQKRANRFDHILNFHVKLGAGAAFAEHFHQDAIESTEVITGQLIDLSENGKVYEPGEVAHWDKNVRHTPVAMVATELHVLFKV
jgi:hypothetical protein